MTRFCDGPCDPRHDLDTPEGQFGHLMSLEVTIGIRGEELEAWRHTVTALLGDVTVIMGGHAAVRTGALDLATRCVRVAWLAHRATGRVLDQLELEIRRRETERWMREAEGKR